MAILVTLGLLAGHRISEAHGWLEWRYRLSRAMHSLLQREPMAKYVSIVAIGSDEYWAEPLSARSPIRRDYLATLIESIGRGNPFLMAIDFDMRSPRPEEATPEFVDYEGESRRLIAAVLAASRQHQIVLPRTIWHASHHGYRLDPDIWSLEPALFDSPNVHGGYIALPPDLRQVPLAVPLANAEALDSFSLAIARRRAEAVTDRLRRPGGRENLPFASYISEEEFPTYSAGQVLSASPEDLRGWFAGRLVLIGGAWNVFAAGRGPRVDSYLTPAGVMPGVFIHANFVEALLDQRTFEPVPEWVVEVFEVALVLACVVVFALSVPTRTKAMAWLCALLVLVLANYIALQNLGRFFDFFIPMVVTMTHLFIEQVNEWRHAAHVHKKCGAHGPVASLLFLAGMTLFALTGIAQAQPDGVGVGTEDTAVHKPGVGSLPPTPRIDPMGAEPVVREEVDAVDPSKPGGAKRITPVSRDIDSMGAGPVVRDGVKSANPETSGGPRRDSQGKPTGAED